ncbi:porin family protein [Aquincola sp. MAHUQ-54]|uniref:Porin family protein n=1 Tax=Aquincola agrisoli TaxID=3119538 RepID=A0AAW9QPL3_9BURK
MAAALGLLTAAAGASAQDAARDASRGPLQDQRADATFRQLADQEPARAGDVDFDLALGVAALDAGQVSRAIFALERVVAAAPDNGPARAELARAYLAAGEVDRGRAELLRVRRGELPPEAARAIDRVLGALDQAADSARRTRINGYLELAAGDDSNVNSATNVGQFALPAFGGLLFTMARETRRQHDAFATAAGGLSVQRPLTSTWDLVAGANLRTTAPHRVHDMNTTVADAMVGAARNGATSVQTIALQASGAWVSSSLYRTANGVMAQWQQQLGPASQASGFAQFSRQEYAGQHERNTDRTVLGAAFARAFQDGARLAYGSVYHVAEHARADGFDDVGHRGFGARLGAEQLAGSTVLFAEWQFERRRYGGREPLFDVSRSDHQSDLLAGLRWTFAPHWQLVPQVRRTVARSNVVLYDYHKTVVQIALRREFP